MLALATFVVFAIFIRQGKVVDLLTQVVSQQL